MIPSTSALVVVDAQNGFVTDASAHVIGAIRSLVQRWQAACGAVVFTRYFNYPSSPFERLIRWEKLQASPETDIVAELAPYAERAFVLDKKIYSLFTDEGEALIHEHAWTDLYICGIATESCVLKTAVDAFERDLTPWLLKDASASHAGQAAHDAGILVAQRFIGPDQVITIADLWDHVEPVLT